MYRLLRKSIVIIAGLCLLFLSGCRSITPAEKESYDNYLTLETLFSKDKENLVYIDLEQNRTLVSELLSAFPLKGSGKRLFDESSRFYLGYEDDLESGVDAVISGDFSKRKLEFGLFWALDWKGVKLDSIKFWQAKDGTKLYIRDDNTIVVSTGDIIPLIRRLDNNFIEGESKSISLLLTEVDEELLKQLSKGYIKNGVNRITVGLDKSGLKYNVSGTLSVESDSKARALARILKLFFKLSLLSTDRETAEIIDGIQILSENNLVFVDGIIVDDKKIIELVNNIIFFKGEADK